MHSTIPLYLITFNCARVHHPISTLSSHLLSHLSPSSPPELIILSLQELAPLAPSFLGGTALTSYYEPFSTAIRLATRKLFDEDYTLISYRNVGLTAIMLFARTPGRITWVEHGGVGTGLWNMGNKGGVGVRLGFRCPDSSEHDEEIVMTFVAAHLAPHECNAERRNADWREIVRGLVFDPSTTGVYTPCSHLFVLGDLNYRTADTHPQSMEYLVFPQPEDPIESNTHFLRLLEQDQLSAQREAGKTMQGMDEAQVTFPPTYKFKMYSRVPEEVRSKTWEWSQFRWPSWTDRILFLPFPGEGEVVVKRYDSIRGITTSDHRPVALHVEVPARAVPDMEGDVRRQPPWVVRSDWRERRSAARRREVVVGSLVWLVGTRMGWGVLMAVLVGGMGGWWVVRAFTMGLGYTA